MIMKLLSIIKSEIIVVMVKLLMIVMTMAMKGLIIVTRMMIHQALGHTCVSPGDQCYINSPQSSKRTRQLTRSVAA